MGDSLMAGGLKELEIIKQKLTERDYLIEQIKKFEIDEGRLLKSISSKEKAVESEIEKLTQTRRSQIKATYDEQIASILTRQKKVQHHKSKAKRAAVVERIDAETSKYRNEDKVLKLEGNMIFKKEKIPYIYNNRLFFALYFPDGLGDIFIILLSLTLFLIVLPLATYYLWFFGMGILPLALICSIIIILFGGLYIIIGKTKYKHIEALHRVRDLRHLIINSKKHRRSLERQILKDKNENNYELDEYNNEIDELQLEIGGLLEKKKAALIEFDNKIANEIIEDIIARNRPEIDSLKEDYKKTYELNKEDQNKLNTLAIHIANEYEGFISKDLLTTEKIEQMEHMIESGEVNTIADAVAQILKK